MPSTTDKGDRYDERYKKMGIEVIDHIIFGNNNYYSFYDNNDM